MTNQIEKLKKQFEIAFKNHDPEKAREIVHKLQDMRHRSNGD